MSGCQRLARAVKLTAPRRCCPAGYQPGPGGGEESRRNDRQLCCYRVFVRDGLLLELENGMSAFCVGPIRLKGSIAWVRPACRQSSDIASRQLENEANCQASWPGHLDGSCHRQCNGKDLSTPAAARQQLQHYPVISEAIPSPEIVRLGDKEGSIVSYLASHLDWISAVGGCWYDLGEDDGERAARRGTNKLGESAS